MSDYVSFQAAFKGDIVTPEHPDYEQALTRWAANARRRAAIVAFVRDAEDVASALKYARGVGIGIAIRGGGHNPAGASSIEDGLVIDLSRHLAETRIDTAKRLAYVGGGAVWSGVNTEAAKYGLATTGGTVGHHSLTLGGGFGYLAGSHGLVIDNLVQATIVLADGTVLTASETKNADLFWGIRGGGSNFGVVTEFVLRLHLQRKTIYGGTLIWPANKLEDIAKAVIERNDKGLVERETFIWAVMSKGFREPAVMMVVFWNGSEEEGRAHYKPFLDIGMQPKIADQTHEMPYPEINTLMARASAIGNNYYMKSVDQLRPDLGVTKRVAEATYELSKKHGVEIMYMFEFWSLDKINSVPNDATAFQRTTRRSTLVWIKYPHDTPEQLATVREVADILTKLVTEGEGNTNINNGYANYSTDAPAIIDPNVDGPIAAAKAQALFGPHMTRLAELKRKYDPDLVFNKWYAIKPTES
ncbi:FAD-binding domain-containing protein [Vararia minispora EC-137]|uniref:FAD-binding domain-containing protein n=1 Tax=Vararia minispora EC-137 TaxID=1314806 RepID=A0ACB8Q540_9AGAM|nr:FAD-binding domain-containing protein [Vararia minispora EC-137]